MKLPRSSFVLPSLKSTGEVAQRTENHHIARPRGLHELRRRPGPLLCLLTLDTAFSMSRDHLNPSIVGERTFTVRKRAGYALRDYVLDFPCLGAVSLDRSCAADAESMRDLKIVTSCKTRTARQEQQDKNKRHTLGFLSSSSTMGGLVSSRMGSGGPESIVTHCRCRGLRNHCYGFI